MTVTVAYADTSRGPIHIREMGSGRPLVLLHWAPASGRLYEEVMPHFVDRGFRTLALDLPGYGRSHKECAGWSIEQIADNLFEALDRLQIDTFDLVGGHLSASIATEMAVSQPDRISHLVLDGVLLLEPDEWTDLLAHFAGLSPMIGSDEAYRSFPFDMVVRTLSEWNPDFELSDESLEDVYALLNDYLEMGLGPMRAFVEPNTAPPPPVYPLADRLADVRRPTLVVSADREPLSAAYPRVLDIVERCRGHVFPGVHPLMRGGGEEYALILADFMSGDMIGD